MSYSKHTRKKTKVKKVKIKKKTKVTNRLGKGSRPCDYQVGNCTYTRNVDFGRYKAHMTECPTRNNDICTHVTIFDTWNPHLGHWHFGKKRDGRCYCTRYVEPDEEDFEDDDEYTEVFSIFNDMTDGQQDYYDWN